MVDTMDNSVAILLVGRQAAGSESIRDILTHPAGFYRLQPIGHLPTALARLAGGGVDLILMDLSESQAECAGLEGFMQLRAVAPEIPLIVLYDPDPVGEKLAEHARRAGAMDCLSNASCATDLRRVVGSVLERRRAGVDAEFQSLPGRKKGKVIAFMGSKGGAGATTVSLNVAAALARDRDVILAEFRPTFGSLSQYLRPQRLIRDLGHLLQMNPAAIGCPEAEACLWSYKGAPRLRVLFGPQNIEGCKEADSDQSRAINLALTMLADYVVVDLPVSLSEANRRTMQAADCVVLVVERDLICIRSASLILQNMREWDSAPRTGVVIVSRVALATPADISGLESQLDAPVFGLIPPAPDLCAFAQNAHVPLVVYDSESLAASSLNAVAEEIRRRIPHPADAAGIPQVAARASRSSSAN